MHEKMRNMLAISPEFQDFLSDQETLRGISPTTSDDAAAHCLETRADPFTDPV